MDLYDILSITHFGSFKYSSINEINNCLSTSKKHQDIFKKSECTTVVLNKLWGKSYNDNSDLFYRIGGIKYIISSVRHNFENKNILKICFGTLCNIIYKNDVNKILVYSFGINNILLKSLTSEDNHTICSALKLFSNMVIRSDEVVYDLMYNDRISYIVEKIIQSKDAKCFQSGLVFIQNMNYDRHEKEKKNNVRAYFSKIKVDDKNIIDLLFALLEKFCSSRIILINNFVSLLLNLIPNKKILNMLKKDSYLHTLDSLVQVTHNQVNKKKIKNLLKKVNNGGIS